MKIVWFRLQQCSMSRFETYDWPDKILARAPIGQTYSWPACLAGYVADFTGLLTSVLPRNESIWFSKQKKKKMQMSLHVNFEVYDFFFHEKSIHYISNSIGPSTHISSWTSSKDLIQCWRFRNLNIIRVISEHVGGSCWLKLQKRKKKRFI